MNPFLPNLFHPLTFLSALIYPVILKKEIINRNPSVSRKEYKMSLNWSPAENTCFPAFPMYRESIVRINPNIKSEARIKSSTSVETILEISPAIRRTILNS